MKMVPAWPWSFVSGFLNAGDFPAGWRLASVDARRIVGDNARAKPKPPLQWTLSTAAVAIWITRHWTTEEAASYFWQTASFPRAIQGIANSASFFIGKPADTLSLKEAALLGGLTIEPQRADPYCNTPIAEQLRRRVMTNLQRAALITPQEARQAMSVPIDAMLVPRNECTSSIR
jgi:membrane peptidoglycan carboxypeptidase